MNRGALNGSRSHDLSRMRAQRPPKETMMDKSPKTRTELEDLVLAQLRATPHCGGALHVTVVPYDDYRVAATWEVASFNPGTSEREKCELALCDIVSRLQQRFDIS